MSYVRIAVPERRSLPTSERAAKAAYVYFPPILYPVHKQYTLELPNVRILLSIPSEETGNYSKVL